MYWPALSETEIKNRVFECLNKNVNFRDNILLGVPGTHLDEKVFPLGDFVEGKPFLSSFVANPNHIGLHTSGSSERYFTGTHILEVEVIDFCAREIMQAKEGEYDGYVATGGTEANIQGIWQLRNYYQAKYNADVSEIGILHSEDTHYSVYKAANLLNIKESSIPVDKESRSLDGSNIKAAIEKLKEDGVKYFIFFLNMGTTMFGSIDDIDLVSKVMEENCDEFWIHIDGAFGGFIYPFTNSNSKLNFSHPNVSSITMDAHKMLQAPYGTGIFLTKKLFSEFTFTDKASYVKGNDSTLCGSRSGANAISVWMILSSYGSEGGKEFCRELIERTNFLCRELDKKNISYFRNPHMNIVTIKASQMPLEVAKKYYLVLDNNTDPNWYKIVVMDHVKEEHLKMFLDEI
jgi:glutamate/tyrosine decarboxylase-like PLP-dependent enzyme